MQACHSTLLNSFHGTSRVSKALWAFCFQDYAFAIGPKYNYFLTSTLSYLLSVNKGNIARPYLISLSRIARREGRTTFNSQSWCCEIRSRGPPEAQYFRGFVGITSYWNWILLGCHSKNFAEAEERVWGHLTLIESVTDIDNTSLDEIVGEILHVNPRIGFRFEQDALRH